MRHELLLRITDKNLRAVAEKTLQIADRFAARQKAIKGDRSLSDHGRLQAIAEELEHDFGPAYRLAKQPLRETRDAIDARKANIKLPAVDSADVVGQLQRMERRAAIAGLDSIERMKLLFNDATDLRMVDAVLAEPPEMSGLPPERYRELLDRRLHQLHGPEMAALKRDEEALEEAEAAAKVAAYDMKVAFDPDSDGQRFNKILNEPVVPWLIDRGGTISVVKIDADGRATYPEASDLERRTGKYFKDIEGYRSQAAAA